MKQLIVTPIVLVKLNVTSIIDETINYHTKVICCTDAILIQKFYSLSIFYLTVGPDRASLLPRGRAGRRRCMSASSSS